MLSLVCVCILHTDRREICSIEIRSFEGDWRCLCENGHEHINLMPFFLFYVSCWRLGDDKGKDDEQFI